MSDSVYIRHVSNAGILLYAGSRSFGIDVFAKDENKLYMDTPPAEKKLVMDEIEAGRTGLLIFTHEHSDHFCAADAAEAMERSGTLSILTTKDTASLLESGGADMSRVYVCPERGAGSMRFHPPGMRNADIETFACTHDGDRYADVDNIVCIARVSGKTAVFTADAKPSEELFRKIADKAPIPDFLAVPFPLVGLPGARRKLAAALTPKQILAFHLPRPSMDEQGWRDCAYRVCERCSGKDGLPMPHFGDRPGETYVLS